MPLPVAHGLVGASAVAAFHPTAASDLRWKPLLWGALLANAPDLDFLLEWGLAWERVHRTATHSIFFALVVGGVIFAYLGRKRWREASAYSLAFLSHTLLDFSTTKATAGVALLWPISTERYRLGLLGLFEFEPGFPTLEAFISHLSEVLYVGMVELMVFFPLLLLTYAWRRTRGPRLRFEEGPA